MLSGTNLKTFPRKILPQPSGQKSKPHGNNRVRCGDRQKDMVLHASQSQTAANKSIARQYVQERVKEYFSEDVREGCEACMDSAGVRQNQ